MMDYQKEQQELNKFFNHYYTLANNRVPWAQSWIADAYFWGWGTQQDYNKFIEWDTKAARNGSLTSARRMLLYYHSIGSYEASATLCTMKFNNSTGEVLKSSMIHKVDDYLKFSGNKNTLELIDSYAAATDFDEQYRNNQIEWRKESALLLKAICYIYGFGVQQNLSQAMQEIIKVPAPDEDDEFWNADSDVLNYYFCLEEFNVSGDEAFNNNIDKKSVYKYGFLHENEGDAYKVRHYIRKAMMGDINAAEKIGLELMEKKDKVDNKTRRLFYHDDNSAMYYLSMAAGEIPNSYASYEAVGLSSDPDKKTFNFDYAKQLCSKIEVNLDFAQKNDDLHNVTYKSNMRYVLVKAFINLAKSTLNENEKREFGNRALEQYQKNKQDDEDWERQDLLGEIYLEAFHEYNTALRYFNECDSDNDDIKKYIWTCKKNGARL